MLGPLYLDTCAAVALLADLAAVPGLRLLVIESVVEAEVQLLHEGTIAPELLALLQVELMLTDVVLLAWDDRSVFHRCPEVLLRSLS